MAILEKITQDDLTLYEILKNPVLCTEFINNIDKLEREKAFALDLYQKEMLCDFNTHVSICTARAVGKTVSVTSILIWLLIFNVFPDDDYIVFTVPNKVHLEPVFTSLIRMFRSNSLLKNFIDKRGGINSSDFTIRLKNLTTLNCRIAGQSGTGANVIGLHTPIVILDEAGYYPQGTWIELQPVLNTWTPGYRIITSGVPTGMREKNVLYHTDMENSSYTKHRVSAYQNPRFTDEDELNAIELYGGKDNDDFIHLVLGQHGKPLFALFDRAAFQIESYPVYKLKINGIDLKKDISAYVNKISAFPALPERNHGCIFGIDLGYVEPTAISILYLNKNGQLKFHGRIRLEKVPYNIQEKLIDLLDSKFNPFLIGIDKGGAGIGVVQRLHGADDYAHKRYDKILIPIDFASSIVIGIDTDGEEIKSKTKPFATSVLQDYSNNHKIIYSSTDMEMITELERMTYTKTPTGDIVYKTLTPKGGKRGEDHFTASLLCMSMAYYLYTDYMEIKKKRRLANPSWVQR